MVVLVHYVAFAWSALQLFRLWLAVWPATAAAASLVAAPEIAFWGRQVMLEVPAFAFLTWSVVHFVRWHRTGRALSLHLAAALLVLAMYTKISVAFMVLVWALAGLAGGRPERLRDRQVLVAAAAIAVALIPLVILTVKFGQANVQSVTGIADAHVSRGSLDGWLWYLKQIPAQAGWVIAACALPGLAMALVIARGRADALAKAKLPPHAGADARFWLAWGLIGYLFFSAIDLKEARHSVYILPPVVMAAATALAWLARRLRPGVAALLWLALPASVVAQTVFLRPVHYVQGYAEAAAYIARHAPPGSRVLFSGYRDGSFVFNMRCREERPDIAVVRADKLLLNVAVRRELGVTEKPVSDEELAGMLDRIGVHYVVAQPGFWADLNAMQRLERLLGSARFEPVATLGTRANYNAQDQRLIVYRNLGDVSDATPELEIPLPIIGTTVGRPK